MTSPYNIRKAPLLYHFKRTLRACVDQMDLKIQKRTIRKDKRVMIDFNTREYETKVVLW